MIDWAARRLRGPRAWVASLAALALTTAAFIVSRPVLKGRQAPVAMSLLIVVLLATLTGGRLLGYVVACLGFLVIDYYFEEPYHDLWVHDGADWIVLATYLVTTYVASHLLTRARAQTLEARQRAAEVERLADIGAETLASGTADAALGAIADVIARTLRLDACEIWDVSEDGRARLAARAAADDEIGTARAESIVARLGDGEPSIAPGEVGRSDAVQPLRAHGRVVGALRLVRRRGLVLDMPGHAFLTALTHYAALGVERVRLVAEAERVEALREADRMKDFVLASVSHDLRTPLTTIKSLAHRRARGGDADAAIIEEQADRLTRMVTDVLDLARVRAHALPLALEINTAEDVVGAALRQGGDGLSADRVTARFADTEGPLLGRFDFVATLRVLGNLLENAIKYTPQSSPVTIEVARDGEALAFAVRDRGPGIAEGERERVFMPFHRIAGAAPDVGGSGLGLAVARALAVAQGGDVVYSLHPEGGSVFTLRVPAAELPIG